MSSHPIPTDPAQVVDTELARWSRIYAGEAYYYGSEPGPIARRAVRYHRAYFPHGGTALDAGCGEGQDLVFLAGRGYQATGIEFTPAGAAKARQLLVERKLPGDVLQLDLRDFASDQRFDLVIAVNSLQFMGADAATCLDRLMDRVAPGGVLGLSLFGRNPEECAHSGTLWFVTLEELLERFRDWQPLEAARLWQWNVSTNQPQSFVTLVARKVHPMRPGLVSLG